MHSVTMTFIVLKFVPSHRQTYGCTRPIGVILKQERLTATDLLRLQLKVVHFIVFYKNRKLCGLSKRKCACFLGLTMQRGCPETFHANASVT